MSPNVHNLEEAKQFSKFYRKIYGGTKESELLMVKALMKEIVQSAVVAEPSNTAAKE